MPHKGTYGGSKPSLYERLVGKRLHDIELPNTTGEIDPRLRGLQPGDVGKALKRASEGYKILRDLPVFQGIDKASRKKK